jgi:hypothetical protein
MLGLAVRGLIWRLGDALVEAFEPEHVGVSEATGTILREEIRGANHRA